MDNTIYPKVQYRIEHYDAGNDYWEHGETFNYLREAHKGLERAMYAHPDTLFRVIRSRAKVVIRPCKAVR